MHRKYLSRRIGLFLLLRFLVVYGADDTQRKCRSNVCFNGGTCVVEDRGSNEAPVFECLCTPDFGGTLCEEAISCSLKCQNEGKCQLKDGKPSCECKHGFGGELCQDKVSCQQTGCPKGEICLLDLNEHEFKCQEDKCFNNPCKNNATCRSIPSDFICECNRGLSGRFCQEDIDECEEEPCLNNGECTNLMGDFKCKCQSPWTGKICEQKAGYCLQKPCGEHGQCEELENNFRCICDQGFEGPTCNRMKPILTCEKPRVLVETEGGVSKCLLCEDGKCENSIEECTVDGFECKNDGLCMKDGNGASFCKCVDGFLGKWCENQEENIVADQSANKSINTCTPNTCKNNGVCSDDKGYARCACLETHTGQFCELSCNCPKDTVCRENLMKPGHVECLRVESLSVVSNTDQPSSNTSTSPFSLLNLPDLPDDFQLKIANVSSCDDCFNAQKCVYADKRLMCLCQAGFSGPVCSERSNPCATMKCSGNEVCNLRRTSFGDTPYCSCPQGTYGAHCQRKLPPATFNSNSVAVIQVPQMEAEEGGEFSLEFTFRTTVQNTHLCHAETILNDPEFSMQLVDGYFNLQLGEHKITDLLELRLNDADWYTVVLRTSKDMELLFELHETETGFVLAHRLLGHHAFNVFTVRFGRQKQSAYFTGCLKEIRINKMPIDVFSKDRSVEVLQGCHFQPQCKSDSCGHGSCIELWNSYRCECRRPYLPPNCLQELQEATFGKDNVTSNVAYSLQPEVANSLASNTEFSFLVRTNKPNGQIFYVGQSGEDDTSTFISCGIKNGTVSLDSRLGGKRIQQSRGRRRINDNIQHLIEIKRKDNNFTLYVDGSKEGQMIITRPFAHPLIVDRIVLGGENPQLNFNQSDESLFKGTLQDVRLNDKNLVLTESVPSFLNPNQTISAQIMRQNLLPGTVSDDLCAKKPCVQGTCSNTFNDYTCLCNKGWMGKNCDQVDFCSSSPCAFESAQCLNTHGGYVCKAPATFAKTSQAKFLLKQEKQGTNSIKSNEPIHFSFAIRTRTPTAQINTIGESLSIELKDENVIFRYTNQSTTTEDPLSMNLSNGMWHSIEVFEQADGQLLASFDNSTVPLLNQFSMVDFLQSNDSWITFGRSQNATGFKGCLHNVRIGDLPELSFFSQPDSGISSLNGTLHFEAKSLQNIRSDGCHSKELCGQVNYCRNNALCRDLFNLRKCECSQGFAGDFCEINLDECAENKDCGLNGKCVDGVNAFSCACKPGFSGPLCTTELDQCVSNPCKNNANCKTVDGKAVCSCGDEFMGMTCKVKRSAKCKDNPCSANNTISCTDSESGPNCVCEMGFHGDLCEQSLADEMCSSMPCEHGGKCVPGANATVECICPSNYDGQFCQNIKNMCKKGVCGHGKCRPVFGSFICECESGWEGSSCTTDINECEEEFPCTNNGSCSNTNGSYECSCPKHYLGKNCEIAGVCTRSPCKNSAECIQKSATEYRCECLPGYTGRNCEVEIDYCTEEPCLNGATCQRQIGGFTCHCIAGFTGQRCETDIDDCEQNEACQHGGQCLDRVNGFECNCLGTGWHSSRCELDLNECSQPDLCQNGECKNLPGSYECLCKDGYIGPSCSMVDPCILDSKNRTLHNCVHGSCVDPRVVQQPSGRYVAEYTCRCYENYTGQFCTHVELIRKPISIGYILGPGIALLVVSILLVCMLFFFVARNRRTNQGTYSPSTHEMNGAARVQMHTMQTPLKKQERLI